VSNIVLENGWAFLVILFSMMGWAMLLLGEAKEIITIDHLIPRVLEKEFLVLEIYNIPKFAI